MKQRLKARNQDKIAGGQPFICHSKPAINARIFCNYFAKNCVNWISLPPSMYRVRHAKGDWSCIRFSISGSFGRGRGRRAFKSDPRLECNMWSDRSEPSNKSCQRSGGQFRYRWLLPRKEQKSLPKLRSEILHFLDNISKITMIQNCFCSVKYTTSI